MSESLSVGVEAREPTPSTRQAVTGASPEPQG